MGATAAGARGRAGARRATRLDGVRVRWADAGETPAEATRVLDAMGPVQRERFRTLAPAAAVRFATGRVLIAELVAELAGDADLLLDSTCARCGADHGAPLLRNAPVVVSVSYAGSLVAAAAAHRRAATAVGIDIEPLAPRRPMSDLAPLFAPDPPPDVAGWTRIEAALKADGRGLRVPPGDVELRRRPGTRGWTASVPGSSETIAVDTVAGPPGHALSIAVVTASGSSR